jgi:Ca-activated chloride channel family protein
VTAFHLLRPLWLLTLLPAIPLWWAYRRQSDAARQWRGAIDPALLPHFLVGAPGERWLRPGDALLAAWVLGALAVAGPTWQREPSPFAMDAPPVMLVLRVTPSMQITDLPPSRLERATEKIADLLSLAPGQAAGLIVYAGSAHLVLPPTRDAAVVETMAKALAPAVMPKTGDVLSDAIALARQVLADGGEGGSILVLADTVAPDQITRLRTLPKSRTPVTLLALLPAGHAPGADLRQAAGALDARLVATTVDTADVASISRSLASARAAGDRPGETQRWRDMGWYLAPVLGLVVLLWFRRGWVVLG